VEILKGWCLDLFITPFETAAPEYFLNEAKPSHLLRG
jgi:hypothetical protein